MSCTRAKPVPGVRLREGVIDSSGTQYKWTTKVEAGASFYIENFPIRLLEEDTEGWEIRTASLHEKITYEIAYLDAQIEGLRAAQRDVLEGYLDTLLSEREAG